MFVVTAIMVLLIASQVSGSEKGQIIDMSHSLEQNTLHWPGLTSFTLDILLRGPSGSIPWYESNDFSGAEHGGTHLDAPSHYAKGKHRIDDIPVDKFVGPGVRVDISEKAKANRDYAMTVQDLQDWEEVYGMIPDGSILFVYSGWGVFYSDRLAYFGSERSDTHLDPNGHSLLHFPGVAPEAAEWLVSNRKICGLGIDTPSVDHGQSTDFMVHRTLAAANIYNLEHVANLDQLPNVGAKVVALPMKIHDGSGAPVRIIAMLEDWGTCEEARP